MSKKRRNFIMPDFLMPALKELAKERQETLGDCNMESVRMLLDRYEREFREMGNKPRSTGGNAWVAFRDSELNALAQKVGVDASGLRLHSLARIAAIWRLGFEDGKKARARRKRASGKRDA